jgi:hypothetical protein
MKFFLSFNIYELMKIMGIMCYRYHHVSGISTQMKWTGLKLRDITVETLVEMGFGLETVNTMWEEVLEQA